MDRRKWVMVMGGMILCWAGMKAGDGRAEAVMREGRPLVIAHRGYSEWAPENTLKAFEWGVESGADLVELDYHVSAEGTEVVMHDTTLDRTTDAVSRWGGDGVRVVDRSLSEIQALDAGSWFGDGFAGEPVPTLEAAITLIQGKGGVTLVERKAGPADSMARLLREQDWVNEVVVQSFDWEYLKALHAELPEQVLGALGPGKERDGRELSRAERELSAEWIESAKQTGARVIGWNRWVSAEAVGMAHEAGLKVWVYTINDFAEAQDLLRMGVDGIITNNPSVVWKAVARLE